MHTIGRTLMALLAGGGILWAAPSDIVLVEQGRDPIPIFYPARPAAQEREAAQQLAVYLKAISGTAFTGL